MISINRISYPIRLDHLIWLIYHPAPSVYAVLAMKNNFAMFCLNKINSYGKNSKVF